MAHRQMEERVADRHQALALEQLRAVRADALHVLQRRQQADGRACLPARGHRGINRRWSRPLATCALWRAIRLRWSAIRLEEWSWLSDAMCAGSIPPSAIRSVTLTS